MLQKAGKSLHAGTGTASSKYWAQSASCEILKILSAMTQWNQLETKGQF